MSKSYLFLRLGGLLDEVNQVWWTEFSEGLESIRASINGNVDVIFQYSEQHYLCQPCFLSEDGEGVDQLW